nr:hypothetical transcript [Hymenolepis microstoma]
MEIIRSRDTLRKTKIFILPDVTVGASELPIEIVAEVVVLTPTKTSCARVTVGVSLGASELPIEIVAEVVVLTPTKTSCARESCLKQGR